MIDFEPKYITFDCYGTLIKFRMADMTRELYGSELDGERLDALVRFFAAYRRDEVLGAWKPYRDVVVDAFRRACKRVGVPFDEAKAESIYTAVPTWGPHPDVPEGLSRLAKKYKLVTLTNAADDQIQRNIDKLGAPFHAVFTAQQAQSYKPRMQGFEYMFDQLNCNPEDVLHVSSSLRYDLMTAHDLGIRHKAFVKRGHEPSTPYYEYYEVDDIPHLASLLGL
ncbi:haloacid dehalogenase type II [Trinickia caryophylli]|uniref:2-haloacid dehalogenase n=1 Tax=Trinickia caryophylli TaxID=28094 RepID=A0A1X7D249_TRICW|nr:haloacid dehalogenase type II [Trinickia caryophylli]PMS12809.1 haloacid dehalogenase type II [Trinickia caryophylli]TRX15227.1 haloacid dehalogenase type II [Trinickia caryophylli]WQE15100.1 haloacid dehalogenase type II [Trinickia caryophylli]SMF07298.1 2-haloacid dehalogenase [Trinickia caryophylli]GLU31165.1 dehalogenase [Trinickia caryophylli]